MVSRVPCLLNVALSAFFLWGAPDLCAEPAEARTRTSTDLSRATAPVNEGLVRQRFLKAAGTDTELDASEFKNNAHVRQGFVENYDRWAMLLRYDKNGNDKIDWLEAKAYRVGLRYMIFAKFDRNQDRKFDEREAAEAMKSLSAGDVLSTDQCCGAKKNAESVKQMAQRGGPTIAEFHEVHARNQQAHAEAELAGDKPRWKMDDEEKFLPFEDVELGDVRAMLDDPALNRIVDPRDKPILEQLVFSELRYLLTRDAEAFKDRLNHVSRFAVGVPHEDDYPFDQFRRMDILMGGGVHRMGFQKQSVSVEVDRAIKHFPPSMADELPLHMTEALEKKLPIISVQTVVRGTPTLPLHILRDSPGKYPDGYQKMNLIILYDQDRPAQPFFLAMQKRDLFRGNPHEQIAGIVK